LTQKPANGVNGPDEIRKLLSGDSSRSFTDCMSALIIEDEALRARFWEMFFANEEPYSRRAAWALDTVCESHPEWAQPYVKRLIEALKIFEHDGLKRHSLHLLGRIEIPDDLKGELINVCFGWLISPTEAVAAKVYSMDILYQLSQQFPEIKHELIDSIEFGMHDGTPGYQNLAKKLLVKLYSEV